MSVPPDLVFFTDRDLGKLFPNLLEKAGLKVERHDKHFAADTPDDIWLSAVAKSGWIAVTRDARIRYSPLALRVLMESGARLFVIVGKLSNEQAAQVFIKSGQLVESLCAAEPGAFIGKVRRDGVFLWLNYTRWKRGKVGH